MKKILGFIGKSGLIKPLPLSGLIKEWAKVKESKNYLRFGAYILGGFVIYGLIFKSLAPETAIQILEFLF